MKMSKATYNHIEMAINGLRDYCSDSNEFNKLRESILYKNDQFVSFVWKIYFSSKNYYKSVCNIDLHSLVSSEGLKDSHIESALKKILVAYK
jgi:hypothetical protein